MYSKNSAQNNLKIFTNRVPECKAKELNLYMHSLVMSLCSCDLLMMSSYTICSVNSGMLLCNEQSIFYYSFFAGIHNIV